MPIRTRVVNGRAYIETIDSRGRIINTRPHDSGSEPAWVLTSSSSDTGIYTVSDSYLPPPDFDDRLWGSDEAQLSELGHATPPSPPEEEPVRHPEPIVIDDTQEIVDDARRFYESTLRPWPRMRLGSDNVSNNGRFKTIALDLELVLPIKLIGPKGNEIFEINIDNCIDIFATKKRNFQELLRGQKIVHTHPMFSSSRNPFQPDVPTISSLELKSGLSLPGNGLVCIVYYHDHISLIYDRTEIIDNKIVSGIKKGAIKKVPQDEIRTGIHEWVSAISAPEIIGTTISDSKYTL